MFSKEVLIRQSGSWKTNVNYVVIEKGNKNIIFNELQTKIWKLINGIRTCNDICSVLSLSELEIISFNLFVKNCIDEELLMVDNEEDW